MGLISWLIVGGIIGWLAGLIMKGSGSGVFLNIIIGVVGASLGGFILNRGDIGDVGLTLQSFLVSLIGAVILLAVINFFKSRN
ncbi:putative membrane protein YeaQ/YmgE (transglycosylase-associated protein family) [Zymomonas mobilis]|uniref:GlsB/YeaQ/YmgE family stress response membrane protein n=1 Tax=Zymomonas mobilis TaxID=542 RepID=UPI00026D8342|nr:GlsB/YeaQ/YmgE family stress response membrane protein [Zymomonas mobilis]AFN55965.1 Transglycosylase-associated protein [Zymomonas mobilis subsp. mobilis ATCC 29191]TQK78604.1 putative membrane protein YeaQ/YmgE (transglycosylase-associated protein family) [Zymomonas mobilis]TQL16191.1 putative membrane protein YeaQ/YmgE (transglycosylase-associated protein family) [Zymomonas mobilis]GEB87002.1 transglycosylase [Zymomonas mobilis subsp. mobilis]